MTIDLQAIKDRLDKITQGEWHGDTDQDSIRSIGCWSVHTELGDDRCIPIARYIRNEKDYRFIVNAPEDIAALINEVERLMDLNTCMSCNGRIDSQCCTICESCWQKGQEGIVIRRKK